MHTVELLEEAIRLAQGLGYTVRQEWLGGRGGGPCEVKGQQILFVDLALSPLEQLDQVRLAVEMAGGQARPPRTQPDCPVDRRAA